MLDWITHLLNVLGYPAIVFLMMLENVFPSELVMPLAGFTASRGQLWLPGVIGAGTFGAVLNALPPFYLSRAVGEKRLRAWIEKHGQWLTLSLEDIDRAQGWFAQRGGMAVFLCRMVPGVRFLISVPAGLSDMKIGPFLLHSALGAGLWSGILACAGFLLGENYGKVHRFLGPIAYLVLGILLVVFIRRVIKMRRTAATSGSCP